MKTSVETSITTAGTLLVVLLGIALLGGMFENTDGRWALGTFAIFVIVGMVGFLTGSKSLMKRTSSRLGLYAVATGIFVSTFVNAFIDSRFLFVAAASLSILLWLDYMSTKYMSERHNPSGDSRSKPRALS